MEILAMVDDLCTGCPKIVQTNKDTKKRNASFGVAGHKSFAKLLLSLAVAIAHVIAIARSKSLRKTLGQNMYKLKTLQLEDPWSVRNLGKWPAGMTVVIVEHSSDACGTFCFGC